jgi:hypothetical protein
MMLRREFLLAVVALWLASGARAAEATVWRLDEAKRIGGNATEVIGAPRLADGAVVFDGVKDGLFVAANPLAGWRAFTVEVLFRPAEGGPTEQRFFHAQDTGAARVMIETRLDGAGAWWLDTFLLKPGNAGLPLIDATRKHPTGRWHWVALRYDGKTMAHFVNGMKELAGDVVFGPMLEGKISLGVRQNRVHWFKGEIREVRFTSEALAEEKLQRVK